MGDANSKGDILVVGSEPAAFSAALALTENGQSVKHVFLQPFGLLGSARDIGLAYPELTEPFERLSYSIGEELALEFHQWSKDGVEDLTRRLPHLVERGSRLALTRTEQESELTAADAICRSKPPVNDEVRLMSGAAVSNYAPVDGALQGSFETHAISFLPIKVMEALHSLLREKPGYEAKPVSKIEEWQEIRLLAQEDAVQARNSNEELASGDIALVAAGLDTRFLLGRFSKTLCPVLGQAFRTPPLKEMTRSSVLGLTSSWGYERYRFDQERRLYGCGIDPTGMSPVGEEAEVVEKTMTRLLGRAAQLFTDFDGVDDQLMKWGVQFTGSCDGLPILGPLPGQPRIQVAAGFSFSAWSRGWTAGLRLAHAIVNGDQSQGSSLLKRCSPRRF
jgi:glycine/D-amino acid oxidase-like deaminating enzyme